MFRRSRVTKTRQIDKPKFIIDEKKVERPRPSRGSGGPRQAADTQQRIDQARLTDIRPAEKSDFRLIFARPIGFFEPAFHEFGTLDPHLSKVAEIDRVNRFLALSSG